ncbi:Cysteine/Histidine-rich C1 domain family protein [Hirschfeldia incana]|nr:Cysteine/Histidine-rich C1 domain family protein [Hirschfeldia incana]
MDTIKTTTMYKSSIHDHPLFPSSRFVISFCQGCMTIGVIYGGYYCNYPNCFPGFFHKKCAEAPLQINHPTHPQHPLLLVNDSSPYVYYCDICGEFIWPPFYSCSTCEFNVSLTCGIKPPSSAIEHPLCHDHPLVLLKDREEKSSCEVCMEYIGRSPSYLCHECSLYFHLDCANLSKEVNHPCHSNHPVKLIASENLMDDAKKICFSCEKQPEKVIYHCSTCNFNICLDCSKDPPPLVIDHTRTHVHPLTLLSRTMPFTCDVCGDDGKGGPYVCLQCAFLTHGGCIDLPRIISINRHEHHISFTLHLGVGYSNCGVCRTILSHYHGAYSCSVCPEYAVHCRCALSYYVWDRVELEGMPNHDAEYIAPFKVVGDDLIIHFSHEKHPLKFYKNNILYDKWLQCEACMYPLGFESIYGCKECGFIIHEKCANFPMKKKLIFYPGSYSLEVVDEIVDQCDQCGVLFDGFKYRENFRVSTIDVHCGSLCEPFIHEGHLHPLYFYKRWRLSCVACENIVRGYMMCCDACGFDLCLYCASLPLQMWHKNDDHPITLHCGAKVSSISWCDICEKELDQCKWFYTCSDCEVIFHARCVLGDFSRLKPEKLIIYIREAFKVVRNKNSTRPLCSQCHARCKVSVVLKACAGDNGYICSRSCLNNYLG